MKKIIISTAFLLISFLGKAQGQTGQEINGVPILTSKESVELTKAIPHLRLELPSGARGSQIDLPTHVDNSKNKFFPRIFNQTGNSCAQATGVGYIYTYEMCRALNQDAKAKENEFNYLHVWNFLNKGYGSGSHGWQGWQVIKENGVPTLSEYNTVSSTDWLSDYQIYLQGMTRTVEKYNKINIWPSVWEDNTTYSEEALNIIKRYLYDHGDGSKTGGIIQFSAFAHPLEASAYDGPSTTGYKAIIPLFGRDGMHAMTIVGYDDSVEFDYTQYKGGKAEWGKGAFICANTWGTDWGDKGFFYAPYSTFIHLYQGGGGTGNGQKLQYTVTPKVRTPQLVFKVIMTHSSRDDISVIIGSSKDTGAKYPDEESNNLVFVKAGGDRPLSGRGSSKFKVFEFGLNADYLLDQTKGSLDAKYFIEFIDQSISKKGKGEILYCSLLDYRASKSNPKEYIVDIDNPTLRDGKQIIGSVIPNNVETADNSLVFIKEALIENSQLQVTYVGQKEFYTEIDILNADGTENTNLYKSGVSSGVTYKNFDCTSIGSGNFILRINADGKLLYKPITIQ